MVERVIAERLLLLDAVGHMFQLTRASCSAGKVSSMAGFGISG
ncbi:hypothetical protein [Actinoplanes rectilineatus]|nr:hypothetical protein [Actinoplanes rectilineatus]